MNASTILLADDEPRIVEIYKDALEEAGFTVLAAQNGQEVLDIAAQKHPDLILLDIKMPVLDGMNAAMKLQENPATRDIKIVFLTAFGDPERHLSVAKAYGAKDFIKKGVPLKILVTKVKQYLNES